jgi:hypothetical protein
VKIVAVDGVNFARRSCLKAGRVSKTTKGVSPLHGLQTPHDRTNAGTHCDRQVLVQCNKVTLFFIIDVRLRRADTVGHCVGTCYSPLVINVETTGIFGFTVTVTVNKLSMSMSIPFPSYGLLVFPHPCSRMVLAPNSNCQHSIH